jgi:hypothetical protein
VSGGQFRSRKFFHLCLYLFDSFGLASCRRSGINSTGACIQSAGWPYNHISGTCTDAIALCCLRLLR